MVFLARVVLVTWLAISLVACGGDDDGFPQPVVAEPTPSVGAPESPIDEGLDPDNLPPGAAIQATPSRGRPPLAVSFSAAASTDSDGVIRDYRWDFGDGGEAFGVAASHVYTRVGTYVVRLTVADNDGAADSVTSVISVEPAVDNVPPSASFTTDTGEGVAPLTVGFDASAATDSDGGIVEYRWRFGDGGTAFGATASHTYTEPGLYTALLTVVDNDGAEGSASIPITVRQATDLDAGEPTSRAAAAQEAALAKGVVGAGGRQVLPLALESAATLRLELEDHAAEAPYRNDLDVYLFEVDDPRRPRYLASSVGSGEFEALRVPAGGRYELVIEASAGSSVYTLREGQAPAPARLEDDFIAGQVVVLPAEGVLPALQGVRVLAGAPERAMLLEIIDPMIAADDRYWAQDQAPRARYATVRTMKRLRAEPGLAAVDLNYIRQPQVRASRQQGGQRQALAWPVGVAAPDEGGALPSYALIQWLRIMAGLSNDLGAGSGGAELIELDWPAPSRVEAATLEAVTGQGVVVATRP